MKKIIIIPVIFIFSVIFLLLLKTTGLKKSSYLYAGSGNQGEISVYEFNNGKFSIFKTINSGYKFVYSVRLGDIYNNGKKYIIAGVSNSFYDEPLFDDLIAIA